LKAIMISGRTLSQGASCEQKMSTDFLNAVGVCHLSEENYRLLDLCEGKNVLLKNEFGEAVLAPKKDAGLPNDMVFIPMGPWANMLVGKDTGGCGTPQFKGLEVDVAATDSPVLDIRDLFKPLKRAKA
jgi:formylmethanofuran dehydrogenase subunit D